MVLQGTRECKGDEEESITVEVERESRLSCFNGGKGTRHRKKLKIILCVQMAQCQVSAKR